MTGVADDTLQTLQDRSGATIFIHRSTLSSIPRRYSDDDPAEKKDFSSREELSKESEADECQGGEDNTYLVDTFTRHVGFDRSLRNVGLWYRYDRANDTTEPPHHAPQPVIDSYWREFRGRT